MASSTNLSLILFFACSLFVQATLGDVICEKLPKEQCAYAVSSSGKRCMLEKGTGVDHTCKTTEVVVEGLHGYIETDECLMDCGVSREDTEVAPEDFTPEFLARICSPICSQKCPNIHEFYFNFAAGEGIFLPHLCDSEKANNHGRTVAEVLRGSAANPAAAPAPGPVASAGGYVDDMA